METDRAPETTIAAWRAQPTAGFRLSPEQIAAKIHADQRTVRLEFATVAVVLAFCVLWLGFAAGSESDGVRRTGVLLIVAGLAFQAVQILAHWRRVRVVRDDPSRTAADSLTAARMFVEMRHSFHSGVWLWSRGVALLPGVPLVAYGFARDPATAHMLIAGVPVQYVPYAWVAILAFAATFVQLPIARRYRVQLEQLDRIAR
jgi:hypothetical protein